MIFIISCTNHDLKGPRSAIVDHIITYHILYFYSIILYQFNNLDVCKSFVLLLVAASTDHVKLPKNP